MYTIGFFLLVGCSYNKRIFIFLYRHCGLFYSKMVIANQILFFGCKVPGDVDTAFKSQGGLMLVESVLPKSKLFQFNFCRHH